MEQNKIQPAIQTMDLCKTFPGDVRAVDNLNLSIEPGSIYGLIGRNGAGKTTSIRMMCGALIPTSGHVSVCSHDPFRASSLERSRVAYVSQSVTVMNWMTPEELGYYVSHFYPNWDEKYAQKLCQQLQVEWEQPVGMMSGGAQRKAAIALAFGSRAEVLLLDEPEAGLDPIARRQLIEVIVEMISDREDATILFSTHIIADLERVAEQIGIMEQGSLKLESCVDDLHTRYKRIQVIFPGDAPPPDFNLQGMFQQEVSGPVVNALIKLEKPAELEALKQQEGVRVSEFPIGLEDLFIELLGNEVTKELSETATEEVTT